VWESAVEDTTDPPVTGSNAGLPRHNRRLSDKLLLAFHQACDQNDAFVAIQLLTILETMFTRRPRHIEVNRRSKDTLVAAHERLWHIRHRENQLIHDVDAEASIDLSQEHQT
jgi:hypothetical protein